MDFSGVTNYENISDIKECSESVLYQAVNNVLSVTTFNGNKIFCPLCVNTFQFKFEILDHLKNIHYHFLLRTTEKSFIYEQCPFCYANFFGKHTVAKHTLQAHANLIARLYLKNDEVSGSHISKCSFCNGFYCNKTALEFVTHIQDKHFLQFTELFDEQFMKANETILSEKFLPQLNDQDSPTTSKKNHFDFSSLQKYLYQIECSNSELKSVLITKKVKVEEHHPSRKISVCRVLNFDTPDENKENSVLTHNIQSEKQLTLTEHNLLCSSKTQELLKDVTICSPGAGIEPIHCSTPKYSDKLKISDKKVKLLKRKLKLNKKPTFKSYFKKDLIFQCGKCKKLFQENNELHFHVKNNHKLFILNLLHPCYQCAICEAKFFKNYYLKKHVILHSSHRVCLPE